MTLPTATKTWKFPKLNQRITFVSLNDTMARLLFGVKDGLVNSGGATPWSVVWSCNGSVGPSSSSDHTDRWSSQTACTTRASVAAAAQSWVVLSDGNGAQILLTYQGATDDVARLAYSPSAAYALAGTTTNQPTATDEVVCSGTSTWLNTATSADRVWDLIATDDGKMFRVMVWRSSVHVCHFGVEACTDTTIGGIGVSFSPAMYGFFVLGNGTAGGGTTFTSTNSNHVYTANARQRVAHASVSSVAKTLNLGISCESLDFWTYAAGQSQDAQGAPYIIPYGLGDATAGQRGRWGNVIDWYLSADTVSEGTMTSDKKWIMFCGGSVPASSGSSLWPWDGVTTPVIA
jgi:hypothetical protein